MEKQDKYSHPRSIIDNFIRNDNLESLLIYSARLHGHYCNGLAIGVLMGYTALKKLNIGKESDGMEEIIAIVEMNNCAVDGIQMVTGCTLGNNALIYRDFGKMVLTLTRRDGKGVRITINSNFMKNKPKEDPEYTELFNKVVKNRKGTDEDSKKLKRMMMDVSFNFLKNDIESLFDVKEVEITIPEYAPIRDSINCEICKESIMSSRIIEMKGRKLCIPCSKTPYFELSGHGMRRIE